MTTQPTRTNSKVEAASIRDVARAASVSTATVSRVLNGTAKVSAPITMRVEKAVRDLGYRPNRFARGLITRRSHVLGVALPDVHGEFYSELIKGADVAARRLGYHLLVTSLGPVEGEAHPRSADALGFVDGAIIMISEPDEALLEDALQFERPVVVVDRDLHEQGLSSVVADNLPGSQEAIEHLFGQVAPGRCWFVGGPEDNFDTAQRAAIFKRLYEAHPDARSSKDRMYFGEYTVDWGHAWGMRAAGDGRLRGAGVMCANDEIAYGVILAAREQGLGAPDDFLIIGFDDSRLAGLIRPGLTSVHVPIARIGAAAVETLVDAIEGGHEGVRCVHVPTHLVVRETSVRLS